MLILNPAFARNSTKWLQLSPRTLGQTYGGRNQWETWFIFQLQIKLPEQNCKWLSLIFTSFIRYQILQKMLGWSNTSISFQKKNIFSERCTIQLQVYINISLKCSFKRKEIGQFYQIRRSFRPSVIDSVLERCNLKCILRKQTNNFEVMQDKFVPFRKHFCMQNKKICSSFNVYLIKIPHNLLAEATHLAQVNNFWRQIETGWTESRNKGMSG